jgi:hypothetical protein
MSDKTLVALYTDLDRARRAVDELQRAGFPPARVSVVGTGVVGRPAEGGTLAGEVAGAGATLGALVGGGAGLLAGLGMLTIPGLGTVLAAGPLMATLAGAGVGVTAGGIAGALIGLGVPRGDAEAYAEGIRRGGALVIVEVAAEDAERATVILERHDPEDVDERRGVRPCAGPPLDLPPKD